MRRIAQLLWWWVRLPRSHKEALVNVHFGATQCGASDEELGAYLRVLKEAQK